MKRIIIALGLMMALLLCWNLFPTIAEEEIASEFTIDYRAKFKNSKKPGVRFNHEQHHKEYGIKCEECHHVYENGENTWKEGDHVAKCIECHPTDRKDAKKRSKEAGAKVHDLKNAFHKNCKDCHKKAIDDGKKAPSQCSECHPQ